MRRLQLLSDIVTDRIRATVTIPTFTQCLIELVQNSLDADCSRVEIAYSINECRICVSDDGTGIEWHDLQYIGTRYATSKQDTESAFGCRGEALASMCQLSRVNIQTRPGNSFVTHEQNIEFGKLVVAGKDKDLECGTLVTVSDLFGNVPARQKELKRNQTHEHICLRRAVENLVLTFPEVCFTLTNNDAFPAKVLINHDATDSLLSTVFELYGCGRDIQTIKIDNSAGDCHAFGYIFPDMNISGKKLQLLTVNNRITDPSLMTGFTGCAFVIHVLAPHSEICVKYEAQEVIIRLKDNSLFERLIGSRLDTAITAATVITNQLSCDNKHRLNISDIKHGSIKRLTRLEDDVILRDSSIKRHKTMEASSVMRLNASDFQAFTIIGNVDNKFIVCRMDIDTTKRMILLIDQHAADERIRLEHYWSTMVREGVAKTTDGVVTAVGLRESIAIKLNQRQLDLISTQVKSLETWGIHLDYADSDTFLYVNALPELAIDRHSKDPEWIHYLIHELLKDVEANVKFSVSHGVLMNIKAKLLQNDCDNHVFDLIPLCPRPLFELLQSKACRSAIMFGDPLTEAQRQRLISNLMKCKFPFQCAHGRPSVVPLVNLNSTE